VPVWDLWQEYSRAGSLEAVMERACPRLCCFRTLWAEHSLWGRVTPPFWQSR
jgi:hypothetical protein